MSAFSNNLHSPNSQTLIWRAEYYDGTSLSEFETVGDSVIENSFYDIDKSQLVRFGLVGNGNSLYFDTSSGMLHLNGLAVSLAYTCGDVTYSLTSCGEEYRDIITYKDAEAFIDLMSGKGTSKSNITKFNMGYKQKFSVKDINFSLNVILNIPMDGKSAPFVNIKLVADKDLDGKLVVSYDSTKREFNAPIKANIGGKLNLMLEGGAC